MNQRIIYKTADGGVAVIIPADTIDFAEGGVATGQFDSSGNFKFNSGYGSAATAYGCRAWVNFNGTGTVAIRASGNVSSITDGGTGVFTINFTTAMPDANYSLQGSADNASANYAFVGPMNTTFSTSSAAISVVNANDVLVDRANTSVAVFR